MKPSYLLDFTTNHPKSDNFAHCSYEAGMLENPDTTPPDDMWTKTVSPLNAPDKPVDITVYFEKGIPVKVVSPQKTATDSVELFGLLNQLGKEHGVGRIVSPPPFTPTHPHPQPWFRNITTNFVLQDIVENR